MSRLKPKKLISYRKLNFYFSDRTDLLLLLKKIYNFFKKIVPGKFIKIKETNKIFRNLARNQTFFL